MDAPDLQFMRAAAAEAGKCVPSDAAYSVGAALVSPQGALLALGYSRELPGNTHAEECALIKAKALRDGLPAGCTMFTTMEPCSTRLSGKPSCTSLLIAAHIARVVLAVEEPPAFVECHGIRELTAAGIRVDHCADAGVLAAALAANRHIVSAPS
jgi:pyrimidine deaminase RibD-like protein